MTKYLLHTKILSQNGKSGKYLISCHDELNRFCIKLSSYITSSQRIYPSELPMLCFCLIKFLKYLNAFNLASKTTHRSEWVSSELCDEGPEHQHISKDKDKQTDTQMELLQQNYTAEDTLCMYLRFKSWQLSNVINGVQMLTTDHLCW